MNYVTDNNFRLVIPTQISKIFTIRLKRNIIFYLILCYKPKYGNKQFYKSLNMQNKAKIVNKIDK